MKTVKHRGDDEILECAESSNTSAKSQKDKVERRSPSKN